MMMDINKIFATSFAFLLPALANAALTVEPYQARYAVSWHGMEVGESVHRFEQLDDGTWRLASETEPYLAFLPYNYYESAVFSVNDSRIKPLTYEFDKREGLRKEKGVLTFDYNKQTVHNNSKDSPWETAITAGMFDKLTHTIAMRQDLIEGKEDFSYEIVEDHEQKNYEFQMVGEESLDTKLGKIDTLKLAYENPRRTRKTIFWVSPQHDFLLIKMKQCRKGKVIASGEIIEYETLKTSPEGNA